MWPFKSKAKKHSIPTENIDHTKITQSGRSSEDDGNDQPITRVNFGLARISKDAVLARLETKMGHFNIRNEDNDQRSSGNSGNQQNNNFRNYFETKRISSRPIVIMKANEDDILHLNEDNYCNKDPSKRKDDSMAIPILPADEMDLLTEEIKVWYINRSNFKLIIANTLFLSISLIIISILYAALYYNDDYTQSNSSAYNITGSKFYNVHMCGQLANFCLIAIGLMVFRWFTNTELMKVILIHSLIFAIVAIAWVVVISLAICHHQDFTGYANHFYSIHSWIGLMATILLIISLVTGIAFLYYPKKSLQRFHSAVGIFMFMVCGAGSITGFVSRTKMQLRSLYYVSPGPGALANISCILLVSLAIFVRLGVSNFRFKRRPKPQWDVVVFRSWEQIEDHFLEIPDVYERLEDWVADVNHFRLKTVKLPHKNVQGE